jgi:isopentenyl-diphosphate delta-isomerase
MEQVVLVDRNDTAIGVDEKMAAHLQGKLHRAVSVFVFDSRGRLLLQQRAAHKYHSGGLWSNTCCGHPRPGESPQVAASRRLREEMGLDCELRRSHTFQYRAEFSNALIEYEYDHVFLGRSDAEPRQNPAEVSAWRWIEVPALVQEMADEPDRFTYWFRLSVGDVVTRFRSSFAC